MPKHSGKQNLQRGAYVLENFDGIAIRQNEPRHVVAPRAQSAISARGDGYNDVEGLFHSAKRNTP
jgi:hypothetical protein